MFGLKTLCETEGYYIAKSLHTTISIEGYSYTPIFWEPCDLSSIYAHDTPARKECYLHFANGKRTITMFA